MKATRVAQIVEVVVVVLIIFLGVSMVVMVLLDGLVVLIMLVLVLQIEGYCQLQDVGIFPLHQISILVMVISTTPDGFFSF